MKRAGTSAAGRKHATGAAPGARIQAACSQEEAALLRQLAGAWKITPAAALRRLVRQEAARQGLGVGSGKAHGRQGLAAPAAGRGDGWVATLDYAVPPIWDAMQSHLAVLAERFREQWPGFSEGSTRPAADRARVEFTFTLPAGTVSSADLQAWLADEWAQIARDAGPVAVEAPDDGAASAGNRAA